MLQEMQVKYEQAQEEIRVLREEKERLEERIRHSDPILRPVSPQHVEERYNLPGPSWQSDELEVVPRREVSKKFAFKKVPVLRPVIPLESEEDEYVSGASSVDVPPLDELVHSDVVPVRQVSRKKRRNTEEEERERLEFENEVIPRMKRRKANPIADDPVAANALYCQSANVCYGKELTMFLGSGTGSVFSASRDARRYCRPRTEPRGGSFQQIEATGSDWPPFILLRVKKETRILYLSFSSLYESESYSLVEFSSENLDSLEEVKFQWGIQVLVPSVQGLIVYQCDLNFREKEHACPLRLFKSGSGLRFDPEN
ncbi:hypothetical protein HNY73_000174 [Argiope bruennichi]|uniref:Uncharacterized protein n=1 Tax=Argiope bruennichi TaxID=94029 RepID=A0A8T0FX81_ARGBR|nr:hypothetical protein HNY73_000174 [Argiope bruennichi]